MVVSAHEAPVAGSTQERTEIASCGTMREAMQIWGR
jgi:hypothetical protein